MTLGENCKYFDDTFNSFLESICLLFEALRFTLIQCTNFSIKPTLKKVSKYENKFAKLQKKAAEFNFRNQLKTVKKKEFTMDEEEAAGKKKPDWALGAKEGESGAKTPSEENPPEIEAN